MNIKIIENFDALEEVQQEIICWKSFYGKFYTPKSHIGSKHQKRYDDISINLAGILKETAEKLLKKSEILLNSKYDELNIKDFRIEILKIFDGIA